MGTKRRWSVRASRAIGILALIAAAGVACGSNGSNSSSPSPSRSASARPSSSPSSQQPRALSVATAIHDPCLLVTLSEARGILGSDAIPETPGTSDSLVGNCAYAVSKTKLGVVTLSVTTESLKQVLSTFTTLAPAAGAGHDAECGASGLGAGSPSAFVGAIDSDHQLLILSPSCAIAVKVAEVAYSKLG